MNSISKSFGVLICVLGCALYGCGSGSDRETPAVGKKPQPAASRKAPETGGGGSQVKELLPSNKVTELNRTPVTVRPRVDDNKNVEVVPPSKPGGKWLTQGEVDALRPKPDPSQRVEVIPPTVPGGRGVTQAEIDALRPKEDKSQRIEVIPPEVPGGRGVTQEEINDSRAKSEKQSDAQEVEVIPPDTPGGHGLTQREVDALRPLEDSNPANVPPPAVEESATTSKSPASPPSQSRGAR
jgi:hypothetical protein